MGNGDKERDCGAQQRESEWERDFAGGSFFSDFLNIYISFFPDRDKDTQDARHKRVFVYLCQQQHMQRQK